MEAFYMESELLAYRANPTNRRFETLYNTARPWLKSTGILTVKKYNALSVSGALDDVVNEGALALSVSARRFSYFCGDCGRVFVHGRDLTGHVMSEHGRRGASGLVSLATFSKTSARLAMKRTARRLYRPEIPSPDIEEPVVVEDVEERMIVEIMISRFRDRLSAGARASLELLLRSALVDSSAVCDLRREAELLIGVRPPMTSKKERKMPDYSPEPNWSALNIRMLRESSKEVLDLESSKRTMKTAYSEIYEKLIETDRELVFTCQNCNSLIDDKMARCWACGLVFRDESEEEEVVDDELVERAKKFGIETSSKTREELLAAIEETETKTRAARCNVDFLTLESKKLNELVTEVMPDGWSKKVSRQYTAYFDSDRARRVAIFHRGLKVHFSVEDTFLDGFPDLVFFDEKSRRAKHYGRVNYEYAGDTAKYALDLVKRIITKHG